MVPSAATVWVTPVSSTFLGKFNEVPVLPYFEKRRKRSKSEQEGLM